MTFNEQNTIEDAIRDQLFGQPVPDDYESVRDASGRFVTKSGLIWDYVHGEKLVSHGKQPQDVFVDTWLKEAICRLNPVIDQQPDLADEVIHRLRDVLLETNYSGLTRINEIFHDWLLVYNQMDGDNFNIY